jgi:hypothetical protein
MARVDEGIGMRKYFASIGLADLIESIAEEIATVRNSFARRSPRSFAARTTFIA